MKTKALTTNRFDIKFKMFNYIQDRCRIDYISYNNGSGTIANKYTTGGVEFSESRFVPGGKNSAFDVSAYIRITPTDYVNRYSLEGAVNGVVAEDCRKLAKLEETYADTSSEIVPPMFFLNGSNVRNEAMCSTRYHIYNPNFPHIVEWMPTLVSSGDDVPFGIRFNNEPESLYYKRVVTSYKLPIVQLLLNAYTDDRNDEDCHQLCITFPRHLEPAKEQETTYDSMADIIAGVDDVIEDCTDTRADVYLYDTRKKGVFLRFIDRFGFVQQILLDISGTESTVTLGDSVNIYQGKENGYDGNVCGGEGIRNNKVISEVIHCGLNSIRKELQGDIMDLLSSPVVYMYRGGFDNETDDDTQCKWEEVRVTSSGITTNYRSKLMDVSIDVLPTTNNAYAV